MLWAEIDRELDLHGEFAAWDVFVESDLSLLLSFAAVFACTIRRAVNWLLPVTRLPFKSRTVI